MSNSSEKPWSNNPNAPQISIGWYTWEKENFSGTIIGAPLYGIVILLFFRCMNALFNPVNRTGRGINWGLVAHTAAMFSFVTIYTALNFQLQSISYINNREYPQEGPFGYQFFVESKPINVVPNIMFMLNNWLADGLLLYRCYVVYAMNYWFVVFPCLMYIAAVAVSVVLMYESFQPELDAPQKSLDVNITLSYYSISLSLNVLLTLMIIARLILHSRNIQNAMGYLNRANGLYKTVATMLVESCALYAISLLLFIVPYRVGDGAQLIFLPVLANCQVIAPFLIILRVANRTAVTNNSLVSENLGSIHFNSRGKSTACSETVPEESAVCSVDVDRGAPHELPAGAENTIEEVAL